MSFSADYIHRCIRERRRWVGKQPMHGDWHLDTQRQTIDVASDTVLPNVNYHSGKCIYVPDADDLLELLDSHVTAHGADHQAKHLSITYADASWAVRVSYAGRITEAVGPSVHDALMNAILQMPVIVSGPIAGKSQ